jgi:hypothetical protein
MDNSFATMGSFSDVPPAFQQAARLKFAILANGLQLTSRASDSVFGTNEGNKLKKPIRTRSGVSGGLDLRLSEDIFVNAPILEPSAKTSEFVLDSNEFGFSISYKGEALGAVEPLREPAFYSRQTRDGEDMARIGQMCSPDRFCYGMTGPGCSFWPAQERCRYCSIGLNAVADASRKREDQLYEVLEASLADDQWPTRHVLLGGGTPDGSDMGAVLAARLCTGIKKKFDIPIYVMIVAPLEDQYIDLLYDAGVDELGMNLEFWSDEAWSLYIPGKRDRVGKERFLRALEYAFTRFGPVRTRSILIAGLERAADTMLGVTTLANMGVMPILSPFRPLAGTALENTKGFESQAYIDLYEEAKSICDRAGVPVGPTCIYCQNNTLALPFGAQYRRY